MHSAGDLEHLVKRAARNCRVTLILVATWLLCLGPSGMLGQTTDSLEALQIRAQEFAQAVSSGRVAELKALAANSFGGKLANIPMTAHVPVLMGLWDQTRGLTLVEVQRAQDYEGMAIFNTSLTRSQIAIRFQLESTPPHKIIGIRPMETDSTNRRSSPRTEQDVVRELKIFMSDLADADTFSGTVLLAHGERIVFHQAYGTADKNFAVPATRNTKYNLASAGKMFTAVAIAQLVERGKLSYGDPLAKFLPDFPNTESAQKILIKHLLSHSAGLGMWWGPRFSSSAKDQFRTVDDLVAWAATDEKTTAFEPGEKFKYSNTGYVLLGKVIEVVSGQSYSQYIRDNIFKPVDMTESDFYETEPINRHLAVGYQRSFDENGQLSFRSNLHLQTSPMRGGPAGGGFSTALDLFKFSRALHGGKLLPRDVVDLLTSQKREFGADRYGFGFDVSPERHSVGHAGGSIGVSNNVEMFLDSGWTAIVLANYTSPSFEVSSPVVKRIRELVDSP